MTDNHLPPPASPEEPTDRYDPHFDEDDAECGCGHTLAEHASRAWNYTCCVTLCPCNGFGSASSPAPAIPPTSKPGLPVPSSQTRSTDLEAENESLRHSLAEAQTVLAEIGELGDGQGIFEAYRMAAAYNARIAARSSKGTPNA